MKAILGTMTFGAQVNRETSGKMIARFLKEGFHEIDTAYVYNNGDSESTLGNTIASLPDINYSISTKVNPRVTDIFDFYAVKNQLEESLERLGLSKVDVLYLHFPDPRTPLEITLEACAELYRQGKFTKLGLSNFSALEVIEAWNLCNQHGWPLPWVYQGLYNGMSRGIEAELLPILRHHKIRFYAYNPLAGGLLTGKYDDIHKEPSQGRFTMKPNYLKRYWKTGFFKAIDHLAVACNQSGTSLVQAAYGWLIHHSGLNADEGDGIILGASTVNQLDQNLKAMHLPPLPLPIIDAFEDAWLIAKPDCPSYFRTSV